MLQQDYAKKKDWNSYVNKKKTGKKNRIRIEKSHISSRAKTNKPRVKNNSTLVAVYYGMLFIFLFGFLFFLSISISYATTKDESPTFDEVNNFTDSFQGRKLLEDHLLADDKSLDDIQGDPQKLNYKIIKIFKYRVKKNETLSGIAQRFGLRTDTIVLTNNINRDVSLKSGQVLLVPNQNGRVITIQKNDSLFNIASRYGISWQNIVDVNNLQSSVLKTGSRLFIPGSKMTRYERNKFYKKPEKKSSKPEGNPKKNQKSSAPVVDYAFYWPVNGKITSYYGMRKDPFNGLVMFHGGLDVKGKTGTPVKAANKGSVIFTGWNRFYGNVVMVRHNSRYVTVYAHLDSIKVKKGQKVGKLEQIGTVGNTGRSSGPHLHFEIRLDGKRINPLKLIK